MSFSRVIASLLLGLCVLAGAISTGAALPVYPSAPRCTSSLRAEAVQQLDCNSLAQVDQFGGCEGFCQNFLQAWGAPPGAIGQCIANCQNKLSQCATGGESAQPNCQWYSKGDNRKYICRIY